MQAKKGFTLIELLVVLAIVAILSVVVILTLNPAELLKQARDSNRISDLGTMKSAISLYLADVSTISMGTATTCYESAASSTSATCGGLFPTATIANASTTRLNNGLGWLPINFTLISSGAPLGNLPLDPINSSLLFYGYMPTSTNFGFKLATVLESTKYLGMMTADGGVVAGAYESGTVLSL